MDYPLEFFDNISEVPRALCIQEMSIWAFFPVFHEDSARQSIMFQVRSLQKIHSLLERHHENYWLFLLFLWVPYSIFISDMSIEK